MTKFKDVKLGYLFQYHDKDYIRCVNIGRMEDSKNGLVRVFNCVEMGTGKTFYIPDMAEVKTEADLPILPDKREDLMFTEGENPRGMWEDFLKEFNGMVDDLNKSFSQH